MHYRPSTISTWGFPNAMVGVTILVVIVTPVLNTRLVYVEKKKPQHIAVDWAENGNTVCYYDNLPAHHRLSRYCE